MFLLLISLEFPSLWRTSSLIHYYKHFFYIKKKPKTCSIKPTKVMLPHILTLPSGPPLAIKHRPLQHYLMSYSSTSTSMCDVYDTLCEAFSIKPDATPPLSANNGKKIFFCFVSSNKLIIGVIICLAC